MHDVIKQMKKIILINSFVCFKKTIQNCFFQATRLQRLVKFGKSLLCQNEGCGAKFTTGLGYLTHQKICGVKEEDREKFTCEICEKVYMSSMGLKYHMQAKHSEVNVII